MFVWFEEFPWVCYSWWEDGAYCLPCVLLGNKVVRSSSLENLYKKPYRTWPMAVKTFKNIKMLQRGHTKKTKILLARFIEYTEYRSKEVQINKVFDSTNKESIKKLGKLLLP